MRCGAIVSGGTPADWAGIAQQRKGGMRTRATSGTGGIVMSGATSGAMGHTIAAIAGGATTTANGGARTRHARVEGRRALRQVAART